MFFCEQCRLKNRWPRGQFRRVEKCEICKRLVECYDVMKSLVKLKEARNRA